ncbi:MAG: hypothetical protein ABI693_00575 [Bryobacteraceae bacterium]
MNAKNDYASEYDSVELRTGRLQRILLSKGRRLGDQDGMVPVVKCYCRSHDVLTGAEAERQTHATFVFPVQYFKNLEGLIGKELEGRIYSDTQGRRIKFSLDLKEHAGFQLEDDEDHDLESPWYDQSVLNE